MDNLHFAHENDANVYDLIYFLYDVHNLSSSEYTLVSTDGVRLTNFENKLSKFKF